MAATAVAAPIGLTIPPVLVAAPGLQSRLIRFAGPAVLAAAVTGILIMSALLATPIIRSAATAGLTLLSATMFPLVPFDGAYVRSKLISLTVAIALGAAAAAMIFGWL